MATRKSNSKVPSKRRDPRCLAVAVKGITTARDFALMMSALMSDIAEERIEPRHANAICLAGSKLLKVVELQHRYGKKNAGELLLAQPETAAAPRP